MDLAYLFEDLFYGLENVLADFLVGGILSLIVLIIVSLMTLAACYAFPRYALYLRGRKAGLSEQGWKAFVPFFSVHYKMQILDKPWWQIFFFDEFKPLSFLTLGVLTLVVTKSSAVMYLIWLAFYVCSAVFYILYYRELFSRFGYSPVLGIFSWVPALSKIPKIIEYIASFDSKRVFDGSNDTPTAPAAESRPAGYSGMQIIGLDGKYSGAVVPIRNGETVIFGRDPQISNILFDDTENYVSRKHCGVSLGYGENYIVTDYSMVGTFFDDGRKFPQNTPIPVPRGTVIYIGSKQQRFRLN